MRRRMSRELPFTMGAELEFITRRGGKPVSAACVLEEINARATERGIPGKAVPDAGMDQGEFVTEPSRRLQDVVRTLKQLHGVSPPHYELLFVNRRPEMNGAAMEWIGLPRLKALLQALEEECPEGWRRVLHMADYCALHMTIGVSPTSADGLLLLSVLNLLAPWIAGYIGKRWHIDNRGHPAVWHGWADPRRFSDPTRWFGNAEQLVSQIEGTTRLIAYDGAPVGSDNKRAAGWYVDRKTMMDYRSADDVRAGLWWYGARPRAAIDCIETREAPSAPPEIAGQILDLKCDINETTIDAGKGRYYESAMHAAPVFNALHARFPFLPSVPPTSDAYWAEIARQT